MNDPLTSIEQQLAQRAPARAPDELRNAVLSDVHRELQSASCDRRLAKTAAALLALGIALNTALMLDGESRFAAQGSVASDTSLVQTAVAVARATDAQTARRLVHQISALNGQVMTAEQLAALDAAIAEELAKSRKG